MYNFFKCVLLITLLLWLVGKVWILFTGLTTPVGWLSLFPTDRLKSVRKRCVIEVFGGGFVLSCCFLDFSGGVWAFVIRPSQISSFFSSLLSSVIDILNVQCVRLTQSYENSIKKCLDERNTHAKYECHMSYGKKVLWRVKVDQMTTKTTNYENVT